jgi:hypothetical protein
MNASNRDLRYSANDSRVRIGTHRSLLHKHIVGLEVLAGKERSRHLLSCCGGNICSVFNDRSFHTSYPSLVDECLEGDRLNPAVRVKEQSGAGEAVMLREPYLEDLDEPLMVRTCLWVISSMIPADVGNLARIYAAQKAMIVAIASLKPQVLYDILCLMYCSRDPCHRYDSGASFNYASGNALCTGCLNPACTYHVQSQRADLELVCPVLHNDKPHDGEPHVITCRLLIDCSRSHDHACYSMAAINVNHAPLLHSILAAYPDSASCVRAPCRPMQSMARREPSAPP